MSGKGDDEMAVKPDLEKPIVGGDNNTWGIKLNGNIDKQDVFNEEVVTDLEKKLDKGEGLEATNAKELEDNIKDNTKQVQNCLRLGYDFGGELKGQTNVTEGLAYLCYTDEEDVNKHTHYLCNTSKSWDGSDTPDTDFSEVSGSSLNNGGSGEFILFSGDYSGKVVAVTTVQYNSFIARLYGYTSTTSRNQNVFEYKIGGSARLSESGSRTSVSRSVKADLTLQFLYDPSIGIDYTFYIKFPSSAESIVFSIENASVEKNLITATEFLGDITSFVNINLI